MKTKNEKPPKNPKTPKTPKIIKRFKPKNPYFCQPCARRALHVISTP